MRRIVVLSLLLSICLFLLGLFLLQTLFWLRLAMGLAGCLGIGIALIVWRMSIPFHFEVIEPYPPLDERDPDEGDRS
jgi:hypothetical protein